MIGDKIRQIRKSKGWKQEDLAERSGYSRSSIINWETGKRAPRADDIERLALILGVSTFELISDTKILQDKNISNEVSLLPPGLGTGRATGVAYWGGVLDSARKLAETRDLGEIKLILPLLKLAYETLLSVKEQSQEKEASNIDGFSAYNGNNSQYFYNTLNANAGVATA